MPLDYILSAQFRWRILQDFSRESNPKAFLVKGLSPCLRSDQHLVGDGLDGDCDAEQGAESGLGRTTAVEAENELVEVGLEMGFSQSVIDTQCPGLEVGEDPMDPGQDDMSSHVADHMRLVSEARGARVAGPTIGFDGSAGGDAGLEEGVQAGGRGVVDRRQTNAAGALALDFDRGGHLQFALATASAAASRRVVPGPPGDLRLVHFDQAGQRIALGIKHGPAQLGSQQPGALVGAQAQLPPQLARRHAVGVRRHQIGRPEPYRQRQLGGVHRRAGGYRGLLVTG